MALLHFHCSLSLPPPISSSSIRPKPTTTNKNCNNLPLPARDRTIDFGKHKGRMLGSLPSTYLRWLSSTLRARDSLHWAELADDVLADPVYRDRIEWESAQKILSGNTTNTLRTPSHSAVSSLQELSERFGWDNEDKAGWARVDFELLGTSKGSRFPRLKDRVDPERREVGDGDSEWEERGEQREEEEEGEGGETRRRRRRGFGVCCW